MLNSDRDVSFYYPKGKEIRVTPRVFCFTRAILQNEWEKLLGGK